LSSEVVNYLGDITLFAAAGGAIVFAISYGLFFDWRRTEPGRALMQFVLSLIAIFSLNTGTIALGMDFTGREYVRLFVYGFVFFSVWRLVWVLWRVWARGGDVSLSQVQRSEHLDRLRK
jgi:hypothetical protein